MSKVLRTDLKTKLINSTALGDSKHKDKINMRLKPTESSGKIYNHKSFKVYLNGVNKFCDYLESKGIAKTIPYEQARNYCKEFLQNELKTKSAYTVASYKASLNMVYKDNKIDYKINKADTSITRGRTASKSHIAVDKTTKDYKDIKTLAIATGGRRSDLQNLKAENIKVINGHVYVKFENSKGGRDRVSHVLPQYENKVLELKQQAEANSRELIIQNKINSGINIHGFRRSYARQSYNTASRDIDFRNRLADFYSIKSEPGSTYITKETANHSGSITYDRQCLEIASKGLGHNRIDVIVNNYMK